MSRFFFPGALAALALACGLGVGGPHDKKGDAKGLSIYTPRQIKWADAPPVLPPGAKAAVLEGDPGKEGPFVLRVRMPDGYRIPPHTHPKPERVTVLSGTFHIGMGDRFDKGKGEAMPAGSFGTWPAGMKHFVWAEGETVIQLHGTGPWSLTYVNPADDPRKKGGLKSGPQRGDTVPGPFNPLNVTNAERPDFAGKRSDYTEQHGQDPVVLIFAREVSEPLTALAKELDAEVAKNRAARLRAVVVVLSDDEGTETKLKDIAQQEGVRNVSLALMEPAGPRHYKLSPTADVVVLLYKRLQVKANHAFKKDEFNQRAVEAVLRDVPRIVAQPR